MRDLLFVWDILGSGGERMLKLRGGHILRYSDSKRYDRWYCVWGHGRNCILLQLCREYCCDEYHEQCRCELRNCRELCHFLLLHMHVVLFAGHFDRDDGHNLGSFYLFDRQDD